MSYILTFFLFSSFGIEYDNGLPRRCAPCNDVTQNKSTNQQINNKHHVKISNQTIG